MRTGGWYLGLLAVLVGCWAYVWNNFHLVPDPMPVHYGPGGEPDAFEARSLRGAVIHIALGPVMIAAAGAAAAGIIHATAQQAGARQKALAARLNPAVARFMALVGAGIAVAVTLSLLGWHGPFMTATMIGLPILLCIDLGLSLSRVYRKVNAEYPPGEKEKRVRYGIYYNADDPETLVSLENGMSTTLNFARPGAWALLAALLAPVVLITVLALLAG